MTCVCMCMRAWSFGEAARGCAPAQWPAFLERSVPWSQSSSCFPRLQVHGTAGRSVGSSVSNQPQELKSLNVTCFKTAIHAYCFVLFWGFFSPPLYVQSTSLWLRIFLKPERASGKPASSAKTYVFLFLLLPPCCSFVRCWLICQLKQIELPSTSFPTVLFNFPILRELLTHYLFKRCLPSSPYTDVDILSFISLICHSDTLER